MSNDDTFKAPSSNLRRTNRSLPIALLRARETVMGPVREMLSGSSVNEQKWRVLRVLEEGGAQDQNTIAQRACLLLPSLTRILSAMEAEGLISRRADAADRRRSIVQIEATGLTILKDHAKEAAGLVIDLRKRYGDEKFEQLLDMLEDLQQVDGAD
ncbi:MarR family transcriptional regulator [uncultured Sulfitobacter sp.]|uniref:MarR family transcriptional regulator n=1 Tax=uncultured Sulfitobacter sp. TaxID=191468 RepID=UPI002624B120|nr:MarR family transcriptional regulator [uncultured Sulfitobacter sp.]